MLILSEQTDVTTDIVCSWLNHYGCSYLRVNEKDASDLQRSGKNNFVG
jgi:hypothetical protein